MKNDITAVILAGGRGSRLGGVDKGLQALAGRPLIEHVLERIQPQVGTVLINCNRNAERYASYGLALIPDQLPGFPGPLAGLHAALQVCDTALLLTVPCDTPCLPDDLAFRLVSALSDGEATVAWTPQRQPVIALYRSKLLPRLETALAGGLRSVGGWLDSLDCRPAHFDDANQAFSNLNTADDWPRDC